MHVLPGQHILTYICNEKGKEGLSSNITFYIIGKIKAGDILLGIYIRLDIKVCCKRIQYSLFDEGVKGLQSCLVYY